MNYKHIIISAIEKIYLEKGVESINIDNIAKKASISKKKIYEFYANKHEIVEEVVKLSIDSHKDETQRILNIHADSKQVLEQLLDNDLDFVMSINPDEILVLKKKFHPSWCILNDYIHHDLVMNYYCLLEANSKSEEFQSQQLPTVLPKLIVNLMLAAVQCNSENLDSLALIGLKRSVKTFILGGIGNFSAD